MAGTAPPRANWRGKSRKRENGVGSRERSWSSFSVGTFIAGTWTNRSGQWRQPSPPVLRHYQVKLRRSGKDQYRGCCPIHRGDGSDAFHVNLARNVFRCFACGAGGTVLDFVAAMEGCSLFDAARRLQSMTSSSTPLTLAPNRKELVTERRKVSSPLNFKLTGIDCAHPYLAGRGITEKTAVEFGVGFYAGPGLMHGRLVIPIHKIG